MKKQVLITALALLAALTSPPARAEDAGPVTIHGAGATFPFPLYSKWISDYQKAKPSVQINYQSVGSGAGIKQFTGGTVDFGASDSPMTDDQLSKSGDNPILHVPTVLGAVVVTYNLPGIQKGLKLDPATLADIFLGKITQWTDAKITALNPGLKLPGKPILVAHRSDGSGTTGIFTDYLSKISPEWDKKVGKGPAVNWPTGLGGKGNEGVSGLLKQTEGAIGYVELIYAEKNNLAFASIKNKAGEFVEPGLKSVTAAAAGALKDIPADFRVSITEPAGKGAYPISGFTYLLVHQKLEGAKGEALLGFLKWAIGADAQKGAPELQYAPLPAELVKKVQSKLGTIQLKAKNG